MSLCWYNKGCRCHCVGIVKGEGECVTVLG